MRRSQLNPMPVYFDRYINKIDDVELLEAIEISIVELDNFPIKKFEALGDKVYAPGKWTVRDILQHLIDVERIFMYRALAFARGEKQSLPFFSEEEYAVTAGANTRTLKSLIAELRIVHQSFKALYESFTPEMLSKTGSGFKGEYSVASIGFTMPGHQRWHMQILEEKYYPLLETQRQIL